MGRHCGGPVPLVSEAAEHVEHAKTVAGAPRKMLPFLSICEMGHASWTVGHELFIYTGYS